jgi:hypothetical protein
MQEHYRLADSISEDKANLIFNNATQKVIKDAFKHAHCIFVILRKQVVSSLI